MGISLSTEEEEEEISTQREGEEIAQKWILSFLSISFFVTLSFAIANRKQTQRFDQFRQ
jgi:hypothetical protein